MDLYIQCFISKDRKLKSLKQAIMYLITLRKKYISFLIIFALKWKIINSKSDLNISVCFGQLMSFYISVQTPMESHRDG